MVTVAIDRLRFGVCGERSQPCGKTDGVRRSPRLPFALVVFFTLVSSFGFAYVLATRIVPLGLSPLRVEVVGVSESSARGGGVGKPQAVVFDVEGFNFDAEAFKRTIVENNLFRPLGWTPPRPIEPYRLIGTIVPRRANTPRKAIIQTTAGNTTYIVSTGESLDADTEVVSIESKQVVLSTKGQQRTLKLPSGF